MRVRSTAGLVVLALLGLALAAGITLAAGTLTSQRVGLSGEPLSAGDELVPTVSTAPAAKRTTPARTRRERRRRTPTVATPAPAPAPAPAPTATTDDHGGSGGSGGSDDSGGRGRGRGSDD